MSIGKLARQIANGVESMLRDRTTAGYIAARKSEDGCLVTSYAASAKTEPRHQRDGSYRGEADLGHDVEVSMVGVDEGGDLLTVDVKVTRRFAVPREVVQ